MEHFFGHRPPVALLAGGERGLHRLVNRPPFLGLRVGRHLGAVFRPIRPMIFKIGEQEIFWLPEEDRVVLHVAVGDLGQNLRPDGGVRPLVFGDPLRLDADHHAHALHRVPPIVCVNSATLLALTLSLSHSTPIPGAEGASAMPFSILRREVVNSSSCGMYSTYFPFGTAQARLACSSMRKCGQTGMSKASAACATLSQGVIPPIRATSTCTIEHAPLAIYSRKCRIEYIDSPTAIGVVVAWLSLMWPSRSSAGRGSSIQARSRSANRPVRRIASSSAKP